MDGWMDGGMRGMRWRWRWRARVGGIRRGQVVVVGCRILYRFMVSVV